jgi:membrane dipeptidase
MNRCLTPLLLAIAVSSVAQQNTRQYPVSETAARQMVTTLLKKTPVIDGHNDLLVHYFDCKECPVGLDDYRIDTVNKGHTDIPRWRKGGVGGQLLNVFGKENTHESYLQGWDLLYNMEKRYPADLKITGTAAQMRAAMKAGKIALLPTLEGAARLKNDPALLRTYYKMGLRSVTFAYKTNGLADGSDDTPRHNGISDSGRAMIKEMNRLGVLIDMSHISAKAMNDILEASKAPVLFSHSNARALCDVNRNVPDSILLRLKQNGGLIMLTFVPYFVKKEHSNWLDAGDAVYYKAIDAYKDDKQKLDSIMEKWEKENPEPVVTVYDMADHFDYVKKIIGVNHIGMAGDFDGIHFTVKGLENVSTYPNLLTELARRGWTATELEKISSGNFLRVFEVVERKAAFLNKKPNTIP